MAKTTHIIFGIHVTDRVKNAGDVQDLFTEYGCYIKTRVGMHRVDGDFCAPGGVIVLEMFGDQAKSFELRDKLATIDGIDVKEIIFEH
ncbi:MAG: hypothetical protein GY851_26905 [bacterium]|nr:hypothetical protein [bacterium]